MNMKWIASPCIIAALAVTPATRAAADAGDAIAGAIVGGILGHAITKNEMQKKQQQQQQYRQQTVRRSSSSSISSAERERNREVQTALNHFGYPVGTPDGVLGSKSRGAISQYQALLGYQPTGQLSDYERTILVNGYHRAVAGGQQTMQIAANSPLGMRAILLAQRDEMAGVSASNYAAAAPLAAPSAAYAAPAQTVVEPELPALSAGTGATTAALPSLFSGGKSQASLASYCNKVSLETNMNGGYITAANMTEPTQALGEQFCIARTYAMSNSDDLVSKVPASFTPAQISDQCKAFGSLLRDQISALSIKPRDQVLEATTGVIMSSGQSPADLSGTARICLGNGYTTDSMDVAIGSALVLTALGDKGYAELLGHHLSQGFGTVPRPDLAADWYQTGLEASDNGHAVFAPGLPERAEVIRKAVFTMGGKAQARSQTLPVLHVPTPTAAP
jgi:peptidoglycan hydrolase-like protein with peptidoglycan-binding domain